MSYLPKSIAAAMLAGVLMPFAVHMILSSETQLTLVLLMMVAFLISRVIWPKTAVMLTLLLGILVAATTRFNHLARRKPANLKPHMERLHNGLGRQR